MAIYHLSMRSISRREGRNAIAAAAYRAGARLMDRRTGRLHNYGSRKDVIHDEIILPRGLSAEWALVREELWNVAEAAEHRRDARVAREFEIGLPVGLDAEQRLAAARAFGQRLAERYDVAADIAIHRPRDGGDPRNFHAHLLVTTRVVTETGLGEKSDFERSTAWLAERGLPNTKVQLSMVRLWWEQIANTALERAGLVVRVDRRSHRDRENGYGSTRHLGASATAMERRGIPATRRRLSKAAARRNAEKIIRMPKKILDLIHTERQVCGRRVVTLVLQRFVGEDLRLLRPAHAAVMAAHAEEEAGRVIATLKMLADRRRRCIAIDDADGLRDVEARTEKYQAELRERIRRDRVFENALRRRQKAEGWRPAGEPEMMTTLEFLRP